MSDLNNSVVQEEESSVKAPVDSTEKLEIDDFLEPMQAEDNIWLKNSLNNPLLKKIADEMLESPFTFVVKELVPPEGDYHYTLKNYSEDLNSLRPGGVITSFCTFEFKLFSIDNVEYDLKQVFSDKDGSFKVFQQFINSLLKSLGLTGVDNPQQLIGCSGECSLKINATEDGRRFANITQFIQSKMSEK